MKEKDLKMGDVVVDKVSENICKQFIQLENLEIELFAGLQKVGREKKGLWKQIYKDFDLPEDSHFELDVKKKQIIFRRKLFLREEWIK